MADLKLRKKALAGDAEAQLELGINSALGVGQKRDFKAGLQWLRKAAATGSSYAMHLIADFTKFSSFPEDEENAQGWTDKANAAGEAELKKLLTEISAENISSKSYRKAMVKKDPIEPVIKKRPGYVPTSRLPKILVIDDEPEIRAMLKVMLEISGYEAVLAEDGKIALNMLADHPDLAAVLCDYQLPNLNGIQFVSVVRKMKMLEGVPIFIVSGNCSPELIKKGSALNVAGWVVKPFNRSKIEEVLQKIAA